VVWRWAKIALNSMRITRSFEVEWGVFRGRMTGGGAWKRWPKLPDFEGWAQNLKLLNFLE
jgi:hypothetical protein